MPVLFDMSPKSIVVFCTDCPSRDVVTTLDAAHHWARDHVYGVHPGDSGDRDRDKISARLRRVAKAAASGG